MKVITTNCLECNAHKWYEATPDIKELFEDYCYAKVYLWRQIKMKIEEMMHTLFEVLTISQAIQI